MARRLFSANKTLFNPSTASTRNSIPNPNHYPSSLSPRLSFLSALLDTRYRELSFPRGRKVAKYVLRHPLLFQLPRIDSVPHLTFTPLMESFLAKVKALFDLLEVGRMMTMSSTVCRWQSSTIVGLRSVYWMTFVTGFANILSSFE
jgi:hypothetical protein